MKKYLFYTLPLLLYILTCSKNSLETGTKKISIKIIQGERISDFCSRIEKSGYSDCYSFETVAAKEKFADFKFVPAVNNIKRFEGLFRPGSYNVEINKIDCKSSLLDAKEIKDTANSECRQRYHENAGRIILHLLEKASDRYDGKSFKKFYEEITLASIIEKEAASNKNYDMVSSVFHNRLNKNMVLGSCPTVEYALGYHRPFLLNIDIAIQSPYNVYKRKGLPPTPIAFFSDEALSAARNPAKSNYIFFVFDWTTGDLNFSEKYERHKIYAENARKNFINKFGKESIHKVYPDKFYEL